MSSRSGAIMVEGTWYQPVAHLLRADEDVWRQLLRKLRVRPDIAKLLAVCKTLHNRFIAMVRSAVTCTGVYKLKTLKLGDSPFGPRVDLIPNDPNDDERRHYERTRVLMAEGPIGADELNDLNSVRDRFTSESALGLDSDGASFGIGDAWYWDDMVGDTARPLLMDPTSALPYPKYAAAYSRSGFKFLVHEHREKCGAEAPMPGILQLDNAWNREPMRKGRTRIEMLVRRCPPVDSGSAAREDVTMRYVVTYRPDQYAGNPHAADAPGIGDVRTHHQYHRRRMEATVEAELTDASFDWARREQYLMDDYDPLKALLTPQMQRDVQGSKDAALWLDLGPDERHDADAATLFRHFTQMPGFPRVETASGKLRGGSGNFALVIVPPRAGR